VPGGKPGWSSGLTQPLVLPESVRQRIHAALGDADDEAPPGNGAPPSEQDAPPLEAEAQQEAVAPVERSASLPRRRPGANNSPEPPTQIARPAILPSLVHPPPADVVGAVPAATIGAIAAAAGTPSDVAAGPEAAAGPGPAIAVPAQRPPAGQQPDRHDCRDGAGNGARLPAPMTRVAMWAYLGQAEAPTEPLSAVLAAGSGGVAEKTREQPDVAAPSGPSTVPVPEPQAAPAPRVPAEQRPDRPDQRDGKKTGPEQETPSQDGVPSQQESGQASLGKAQVDGVNGLAHRPEESPSWAPGLLPTAAPLRFAPPKSVSPKPAPAPPSAPALPPGRPGRSHRVIGAVLLLLLAATVFLLYRHGDSGKTIAPAPTTAPTLSAAPGTPAEARAAAAAWVASQVSRARPISCDPPMCQELQADGVPAADLMVLKAGGGDPLRSGVIVVTPAVTKMVGTELLNANAPAAIASFGSGSAQISVRVIFPQGAAAYSAALRKDIANRKANEGSLLENPRVTAPAAARRQLQDGQVDSRLLLTLAQLASQRPLSIVAFGDRAPGASPGIPLRSADLAATGDAAGRARQMSTFAHQLQGFFAGARIRAVHLASGHDVVRVEFAAPSPLGVLSR
jgi:hypothetical protein